MLRSVAMVVLVVASAGSAIASPRGELGLAWTAPDGCPDVAAMRARIEQRLGEPVDDVTLDQIGISIARAGDRLVAEIDLRAVSSDREPRTLTSTSCDELADAVAVIVARVARKRSVAQAADDETPDGAGAAPAPVPAPVVAAAAPRAPSRWSIGARTSLLSGVGAQPGVGLGGEADLIVRHDWLAIELGAARWFASSGFDAIPNDQIAVAMTAAVVRVGWRAPTAPIGAWIVGDIGTMEESGSMAFDVHAPTNLWVAAGAGVGVRWPIRPWIALYGAFELAIAIERPQFQLIDSTVVFEPAWGDARVALGTELRWP